MPRAKKPRRPAESPRLPRSFDPGALAGSFGTHTRPRGLYAWTYDDIVSARDDQVRGRFRRPVELARSLLTEPAIYAPALNRLAPHRGLPRDITCRTELRGTPASILEEARMTFCTDASVAMPTGVQADAIDALAMHAVQVEQVYWEARADGSRLDAFVTPWPLDCTEWSDVDRCLMAITTEGRVRIEHGDGRWIVTAKHHDQPWRWGALVPLAGLWCDVAFARRDRSKNAESHGEDKWLGTLPEGVPLSSPEADEMLEQLQKLYEFRRVMLKPHGSEVERNEAMGQNWQIFKEIIESDLKDAQRILLGQDGTMTNTGGNYIKAWGLFGVRNDIVESDLSTRGSCLSTGLLRPWSLINFGRWDRLEYGWQMPDADEDARRESIATRRKAFFEAIGAARQNGFVVDQAFVDRVASEYGVSAPTLAAADAPQQEAAPAPPPPAAAASDRAPTVVPHRHPLRAATG